VGFALTLNLLNLDGFIAHRNIERFEDTGKLDVLYLTSLSDDALPAIGPLLEDERLPEEDRLILRQELGLRLYELDRDRRERGVLDHHFGKARAWRALDEYRDTLGPYLRAPFRSDPF
jgi:hypothetical protein